MPTYQYACTTCDERLEVVQKFSDDPLTECAECGGRLRKLFSPVGIVFKGSGFYRTDSRDSSSKVNGAKPKENAAAGPSSSSDAGSGSAGEAKPAAKTESSSSSPGSAKADSGAGSGSAAGTKVA